MSKNEQLELPLEPEPEEVAFAREEFARKTAGMARRSDADCDPFHDGPGGPKFDGGKVRMDLVLHGFPKALLAVGDVATFGAKKYAPHSWKTVPDALNRYKAAQYRHELAACIEGDYDLESGLLHAAHAAWNALATLELFIEELEAGGPIHESEKNNG